jgi:hypothetical protein
MRPARPQLSDTTPQFDQSTSDKAVLLKAANVEQIMGVNNPFALDNKGCTFY